MSSSSLECKSAQYVKDNYVREALNDQITYLLLIANVAILVVAALVSGGQF